MKYFCCSDVHSFYSIFKKELDNKGFDINNPEHILIIGGDLFDRGEESIELLKFVQSIPDERFIYIRGNHEDLLQVCVNDIKESFNIPYYHYHNGTVDTIEQFCGKIYSASFNLSNINPVLDYINKKCIDYYELGDYIFVHGWIPNTNSDDWRSGDWNKARWFNGMERWKSYDRLKDKTIVCGHWHTSWGHCHLHKDRVEWPSLRDINYKKSFEPFIDEGIIALDGCTAYSGVVNILVIEA